MVEIRVPEEDLERLDQLAEERRLPRAALGRSLLCEKLDEVTKEAVKA